MIDTWLISLYCFLFTLPRGQGLWNAQRQTGYPFIKNQSGWSHYPYHLSFCSPTSTTRMFHISVMSWIFACVPPAPHTLPTSEYFCPNHFFWSLFSALYCENLFCLVGHLLPIRFQSPSLPFSMTLLASSVCFWRIFVCRECSTWSCCKVEFVLIICQANVFSLLRWPFCAKHHLWLGRTYWWIQKLKMTGKILGIWTLFLFKKHIYFLVNPHYF